MRPALYACLFASVGLLVQLLIGESAFGADGPAHWRAASASGLLTASVVFALCALRFRLPGGAAFSLLLGALTAGVCYWRLAFDWPAAWNFFALGVSLLIAVPFYQSWQRSLPLDYAALHRHAWGNTVMLGLAALFTGISFGMAHLLAALLQLVGLDMLEKLLQEQLFTYGLAGAACGGALAVLREHHGIISATQGLIQSILSLLVVPMTLGFALFLGSLPFTGLSSLWEATHSTTPIVFFCAAGAVLLINAVLRESDVDRQAGRWLQNAARILALCVAPLSVIAIVSLNVRVQQYGWTPDRLWAALICALLSAYGLLYVAAAFSAKHWQNYIRRLNTGMAMTVAAIALFLATPLLDFGTLSARDQLARLSNGKTSLDDFDAAALAFDFGPAGRKALKTLNTSGRPALAEKVKQALESDDIWSAKRQQDNVQSATQIAQKLQLHPPGTPLDESLRAALERDAICDGTYCHLLLQNDNKTAVSVSEHCWGKENICSPELRKYERCFGEWQTVYSSSCQAMPFAFMDDPGIEHQQNRARQNAAALAGEIEIREVTRLQLFIGGEAIAGPFD